MTADNNNVRNMNGVTGHSIDEISLQEVDRPSPTKRATLAVITFIPALAILSIINLAITQLLVAQRPTNKPHPQPRAANDQVPQKNSLTPKIVTKTVYIEPTQADLARLSEELEVSDPLPPFTYESKSSQLDLIAASLKTAANAREEKLKKMAKDSADLKNAHLSSVQRFEEDISLAAASEDEKMRVASVLHVKLSSLRDVLSLSKFSTIDSTNLTNMFDSSRTELDWLLKSTDGQLFFNADGVLLETLINGSLTDSQSECPPSFLQLDDKNVTLEFIVPPGATATQKVKAAPPVPIGTARESDLFQSVDSIRNILSRRDPTLLTVDDNGSMHSPLSPEGTESIRQAIIATANNVKKQRQDNVDKQKKLRLQWMSKVESSMPTQTVMDDDDDGMCANSNLVEHMVAGGLEGLRKKSDLGTAVRTALFPAFVDESNQKGENTGEKMKLLTQAMKNIVAPQIDYDEREVPSTSAKKSTRKSFSYLVDGPLLHKGFVGWTNYFVDFISGYNDNVDALLDWIVGESQSTVGEIVADGFLRLVRHIPFHDRIVDRAKTAGILAGRTRSMLEE